MPDLLKHIPDEITFLHKKVREMVQEDIDEDKIIEIISKEGVSTGYAYQIIENVLNDIRYKKDFYKLLVMAIFTICGALLINYFSFFTAYKSGIGMMLVFWGLVIGGMIMLIQAIALNKRIGKY